MKHAFLARGQVIVTLLFALPLAFLGFRVAAWGGLMAGTLVGSVIAARLLMRGTAESAGQPPRSLIIAAAVDDTAEVDARRVAQLQREFDAAVLENSDAPSPERRLLH